MNAKEFKINITSEIGNLKSVLLHRPGKELERLTIDNMDSLLFDDILWLQQAQKQHDAFARLLKSRGVEVFYLVDFLIDVLKDREIRRSILEDAFLLEALDDNLRNSIIEALCEVPASTAAETLIAGISKKEVITLIGNTGRSLTMKTLKNWDLVVRPLPNLYFQRDPSTFVGKGAMISVMNYVARQKETLLISSIMKYHPLFKNIEIYYGLSREDYRPFTLEGGDLLSLSPDTIAIGISERTKPGSIEKFGERLAARTSIKNILAVDLPKKRATMHLDTVFTMVDVDAFTVYPGIVDSTSLWKLSYEKSGRLRSILEHRGLRKCLQETLSVENIRFIETGGGDMVSAAREQWNDGTNTLAIAPGEVITYRRNEISNRILRDNGITVHEIDGSELGRGRGGPRCMTMPICRDDLV